MGKVEYQLPHMPNGLMALEAAAGGSFHTAISDFVLFKFQETIPNSVVPNLFGDMEEVMIASSLL